MSKAVVKRRLQKIWFVFLAAISLLSFTRVLTFGKRYSTQLGFMLLICLFLAVTVGEGQAYDLPTPNIAAHFSLQSQDGFLGKPQFFSDQTVLTGEVQQTVGIVYNVEEGDSIIAVAKRYDISVGSILDANKIKPADADKIKPDTQLIIPAVDSNTSMAWLDTINQAKEAERAQAEALRQKQLANQLKNQRNNRGSQVVYSSSSGYTILATGVWGDYNGGAPGYCTWWANKKRPDLPNIMGNAREYLGSARAQGIATGTTPKVGSLLVTSENSYYGHVAYVEAVSGDRVTISEMNYVGRAVVNQRTLSVNDAVIRGYVYW